MLYLAQINIARMVVPSLNDSVMAEFVAALEPINQLAEESPGFIWRLQDDQGNATNLRPFGDERILVNLSVWTSLSALQDFAYRSRHAQVLAKRRQWFEQMASAYYVLWWVAADHRPTVSEAKDRLDYLEQHGPSSFAFTFKHPFDEAGLPLH